MTTTTNERLKKDGIKRGVRTQKMTTFRCDNDLLDWLAIQPNKGGYINTLIRNDMEAWKAKHLA